MFRSLCLLLLILVSLPDPTRAKACEGENLEYDSEIRQGSLKKKPCQSPVKNGDFVRIEYTEAFYTNCTVFYDTRTDSQKEDSFTTHGVVLQAGALVDVENILNTRLNNMCIGDVRKVTASAKYAYGELAMDLGEKRGNVQVPANSTIIYQIEVLDITPSDEIPEDLLQNMLAKSKGAVVKSDPMGGALGALDLYKRVKLTEELHPEWSATEQGKGVIEQATKEYDHIMEQMEVERAKKAEREAKKAAKEAAEEEL